MARGPGGGTPRAQDGWAHRPTKSAAPLFAPPYECGVVCAACANNKGDNACRGTRFCGHRCSCPVGRLGHSNREWPPKAQPKLEPPLQQRVRLLWRERRGQWQRTVMRRLLEVVRRSRLLTSGKRWQGEGVRGEPRLRREQWSKLCTRCSTERVGHCRVDDDLKTPVVDPVAMAQKKRGSLPSE